MKHDSADTLSEDTPSIDGRGRVVIDAVRPQVDGYRYPVKRVLGDTLTVEADLLADGHDRLGAMLLFRPRGAPEWREARLEPVVALLGARGPATGGHPVAAPSVDDAQPVNDRWRAAIVLDALGTWEYTVSAWVDAWGTWAWGLRRKLGARQDVALDLRIGAELLSAAAERARGQAGRDGDAMALRRFAERLAGKGTGSEGPHPDEDTAARAQVALSSEVMSLMRAHPDRSAATTHDPPLLVTVDPVQAVFSSWYEMFPRSCGEDGRHGTFRDAETRLAYIADMGFDIVYLPPIHPIGRTHRKGRDNSLTAAPDDPGSPWAIGSAEGGHLAVHPELGTLEDFRHFLSAARAHGLAVAMDIALQTSPDHPYVKEHPEWFVRRPDGSIQFAENPPKKYEDIYPFNFAGPAWESLWREVRGIFLYWIEQGVRVFRVDNPHTKSIPFWRWCLSSVKERHPDVIFLAEAFTRPKLMDALAKVGFSQSYTYFTWRTTKAELMTYIQSLVDTDRKEFFRPNFWPNTPDILPEHLQFGTRATFVTRAVLAATLSPSWGVYGPAFELQEREPRAGSEEYANNEKYQLRRWDLARADSLRPVLRRLNNIRRDNPALQRLPGTVFHQTDNEALLCYSRVDEAMSAPILVVVNLDPHNRHTGWLSLDLEALGIAGEARFQVHDLMSEARYLWQGPRAFVSLDPQIMPAHVFRVRRHVHTEQTFEYYL
jgi:starch synthase (maltosyl-transferring)